MIRSLHLFVLLSLGVLSGCVTGTRMVELNPPAIENNGSTKGAIYIGEVADSRQFEQKPSKPSTPSVQGDLSKETPESLSNYIGRQRNGYGKALGTVRLPNDGTVQQEMRDVLTAGLQARGYTVTEDQNAPIKLTTDITRFWAWFAPGFVTIKFTGNVETALTLEKDGASTELVVEGEGRNQGQVASNANWALAFSRAFASYIENLNTALDSEGF